MFANKTSRIVAAAFAFGLAAIAQPAHATDQLAPKDAGARYGQALGALEICPGSKITDKTAQLKASYTGDDLLAFETQAAKVFEAWLKVKACTHQDDPNQCKIIMDRSCEAAAAEIGANGTAMPGLLEFPKY